MYFNKVRATHVSKVVEPQNLMSVRHEGSTNSDVSSWTFQFPNRPSANFPPLTFTMLPQKIMWAQRGF